MASFDFAIPVILKNEGGLVDDPADHGGITNFGLTLGWLNGKADPVKYAGHAAPWVPDDVRNMTQAAAAQIYKECMWDPQQYGLLADDRVGTKVFDAAVNLGESRGERFAQRAANNLGCHLVEDGQLGPASRAAINGLDSDAFLRAMGSVMADFYNAIVAHDPTQAKFLKGWLRRAAWPF